MEKLGSCSSGVQHHFSSQELDPVAAFVQARKIFSQQLSPKTFSNVCIAMRLLCVPKTVLEDITAAGVQGNYSELSNILEAWEPTVPEEEEIDGGIGTPLGSI